MSEKATRVAHAVILAVAANLAGGCQMLRIGDGAHVPSPRDPAVGLSTAWAVYRGAWPFATPRYALRSRPTAQAPLQHGRWLLESVAAYGGCLGPGAGINSGEVAAMVACLREAIHVRRTQARS